MSDRIYIQDLGPNQLIEGMFTIHNAQLGLTRQGKSYLKCLIGDKTGRLAARMWNATEEMVAALPTDGFVFLEGQTQPYQGQLQVILQHVEKASPMDKDLPHLMPCTSKNIDQMFDEVVALLRGMEHEAMRVLAETYLQDAKLMETFKQAPAAQTLHHAFLGGLLEHTHHLMQLADKMLPLFPELNRDLVLMGLFIHDLGKCAELTWKEGFGYTDEGQLIGHIVRGAIWLEQKAAVCAKSGHPLPHAALTVLQHIVLSHHGKPEYGAAKLPSTPEALFIAMLDNLEAKMQMANEAVRDAAGVGADLGGNFTEKVWALDNVKLFRPDPLDADQPATTS